MIGLSSGSGRSAMNETYFFRKSMNNFNMFDSYAPGNTPILVWDGAGKGLAGEVGNTLYWGANFLSIIWSAQKS